jgi:hypothetical protein
MARPKIIKWPIGFEKMLRYVFKKKRPEQRLKFYRLFLRDFLRPNSTTHASPDEIEDALRADRKKMFSEDWSYDIRLWSALSFDKWKSEHFKVRATKMAAARWSKSAAERAIKKDSEK